MGSVVSHVQMVASIMSQFFPPASHFSPEQMPDLSGRVVIVTGGNTGIGKETVKALLQHNATVYLAARSKDKAHAAIDELRQQTGREAQWLELDLASLASVKKAAGEFLMKERELHMLFNNAGIMFCSIDLLTTDGYDMQFGTNVLGHFLFTELLLPALIQGAKSSPDRHARVVTTSSSGAYGGSLNYATFRSKNATGEAACRKTGTWELYFQSKLANVVVAREVARRYADQGIISVSCNPGNINTDLYRHLSSFATIVVPRITYQPSYGALTQLWAGTMPDVLEHNGEFLIPWARFGRCKEEAYDPKVGEELWRWLEEQVKDFMDPK